MPETPNRRSVVRGPPSYLMRSYDGLSVSKKKQLNRLGLSMLVFGFAVPMLASVGLRAFTGAGLPLVFWLFSGVVMVVGVSLAWPQLGIYLIGSLPNAVGKLLPKSWATLLKKPERRNGDDNAG